MYKMIRESNVRYNAISLLTQLGKEHWALLLGSREVLNGVGDEKTERLESENIERGGGEGEKENGDFRDVEGVGCLENDKENEQHASDEEGTMGAQEDEEHESSFDKGDQIAARELKGYLLEIQRRIDPSTRQVQEPNNAIDHSVNFNPQPSRVNRSGASGQDYIETPQQDNASEKGSRSQGTWSGRVRPRLSNLLKKTNSPVRRTNKYWTPEEVEALREGVKEYGKSWKAIKNANPTVLGDRTEVDLKDKWRNLVRYG
ncbi:unnamed protein product [Eruca vesicaria subsp. sativa]|uniref:MYB transcription factor n=1 Tax=Eruca vesicaria subsp. sativa TaxID=29727 RepID=A0ABC8KS20_ERUVS|nr:unnamed protein product [Eruca vesicaria subsp. sativa]